VLAKHIVPEAEPTESPNLTAGFYRLLKNLPVYTHFVIALGFVVLTKHRYERSIFPADGPSSAVGWLGLC
jgi:hypothetical protein